MKRLKGGCSEIKTFGGADMLVASKALRFGSVLYLTILVRTYRKVSHNMGVKLSFVSVALFLFCPHIQGAICSWKDVSSGATFDL